MALPEMRLVLNFSFLGAILAGLIFYYGKTYTDQKINWRERQNNYIRGFEFFLLYVVFSAIPAILSGLALSLLGNSWSSLAVIIALAVQLIILYSWRNKGKDLRESDRLNERRELLKVWFFCFISFIPASIALFLEGFLPAIGLSFVALPATVMAANLKGKIEADEKEVKVKTGDEEFLGELFRVDNKFFYFWTVGRTKMVNQDDVETMDVLPHPKTEEKDVLFDSVGYTGSFVDEEVDLNDVSWSEDLNWIEHYSFGSLSENNLDISVVYHGKEHIDSGKQSEIFRKVVESLSDAWDTDIENQVKQRHFKEVTSEDEYLTISFRKHSENPMKLVKKPEMK